MLLGTTYSTSKYAVTGVSLLSNMLMYTIYSNPMMLIALVIRYADSVSILDSQPVELVTSRNCPVYCMHVCVCLACVANYVHYVSDR